MAVLVLAGSLGACSGSRSSSPPTAALASLPPGLALVVHGDCVDSEVTGPIGSAPEVIVHAGGAVPSVLETRDVIAGSGPVVKPGQTVTAQYSIYVCFDGLEIRSSWDTGVVATTVLKKGRAIEGWVKGVPGMRVGGRRLLFVPPAMGYGRQRSGPIPGQATLLIVVDVMSST